MDPVLGISVSLYNLNIEQHSSHKSDKLEWLFQDLLIELNEACPLS